MWPRVFRLSSFALAAVLGLAAGEAAAQGCAMCKTAVGGPEDPLASGINTSILFMMVMPFALFAAVGGWLAYAFWGHRSMRPDLKHMHRERRGAR